MEDLCSLTEIGKSPRADPFVESHDTRNLQSTLLLSITTSYQVIALTVGTKLQSLYLLSYFTLTEFLH